MRARMKSGKTDDMPAPTSAYLAFTLVASLVAAVAGAWTTSAVAGAPARTALLWLASVIVVMGAVSARTPSQDPQPAWYKFVIPLIGVAGVAIVALRVRAMPSRVAPILRRLLRTHHQ